MGIKEIISAYRSPWQNPFVERVIGSIRRDCLDLIIIFNERHLRRILKSYFEYYHNDRTHLGLIKTHRLSGPSSQNRLNPPKSSSSHGSADFIIATSGRRPLNTQGGLILCIPSTLHPNLHRGQHFNSQKKFQLNWKPCIRMPD